ncbi:aaa ATPase domain containing protein [Grosmannia clavigera kw1407]|uniref:Aaa ATPase domain containing protein n=1 Tax=Grosmannia clavigera (strain kw1407 / UAMH 11150) TaxID=655863 RepID=F0XIA2_GROCL|nr:aaa ATPase domain containing protein [Grosmannia clavigera kw1407]EFX02788.1 aaa ATPase domain containing protein [Grosmannia clavigera kw1407]
MSYLLERPALGQKVEIGTFYNAYNDTFQRASLFSGVLPPGSVDSTRRKNTSTGLSYIDSQKGRLDLLGVDPKFGASIFSGLAPARGSGDCLHEQRKAIGRFSSIEHYGAFHHRVTTVEDRLQTNNATLQERIAATVPLFADATHVVVGIVWGCQTVIIARCVSARKNPVAEKDDTSQVVNDESLVQVMAMFRKAVDELQFIPDPDLRGFQGQGLKCDISAYSEVFDNGGMVLQDFREAFNLVKLLPSLLQHNDTNDGKGEPVQYALLPIQSLGSIFGLRDTHLQGHDRNLFSVSHELLDTVMEQFGEVETVWCRLVDYASYLAKHRPYVSLDQVQDVDGTISIVKMKAEKLKQTYAPFLMHARLHGLDRLATESLLDDLQKLKSSCVQLLDLAVDQNDNINFSSAAVNHGAVYIGHNDVDLDKVLGACAASQRDVYVFKFSQAAITADRPAWDANRVLLEELLERHTKPLTEAAIVILDCDALGQQLDRVQIAHYEGKRTKVTQDLLEQRLFEASQSFARWTPGALESDDDIRKPVQRRMVKIPCPRTGCSNFTLCHWICSNCNAQIEFGYSDDYFYCDCGRAKFDAWQFKCNSAIHGKTAKGRKSKKKKPVNSSDGYVAPQNRAKLLSSLKNLEQSDYINILILGETGVGKSTFINSLVNYLTFETLEEAKRAEELNWVIPSSFSIQTMDRSQPNGAIKERKIQVGVRDDEKDGSKGASATQQTAVYPINVGSKTIRLIDTPGIGDTRGLAFDKKNMADILRTLSSYEQLHGVLILLKSNNSRLTVTFNFCMQELLTHLHRSASRNMAFGFTNTRISNYSPGDTFGPLTSLLGKHKDIGMALENQNTFCFDSESFRFLAAYKKNIFMENEEDFQRSWNHSREEAVRLVKFFESKVPHEVKSTMSLNGTRQLIAELTKPMTNISQTINTNIKVCSDQMEELRDTRLSGGKLFERLQVPKVHLKSVKLDRPRTVCRNKDCIEFRDNGTGAVEYTALVTDTEARRLFEQNESDVTVKQAAIQDLVSRIAEYKEEHAKIQQSAARFGIFLKKHSITPYNDATLEYLDMLIQEEEQKARVSRDNTKVGDLRKDYAAHIELVKTLENSMAEGTSGSVQLDDMDVEAVVHELYDLPHFGRMLRDVKNGVVDAHQAINRERPHKVRGRASASRTNLQRQPPPASFTQHGRTWSEVAAEPSYDYRSGDHITRRNVGYQEYVGGGSAQSFGRQVMPWLLSRFR